MKCIVNLQKKIVLPHIDDQNIIHEACTQSEKVTLSTLCMLEEQYFGLSSEEILFLQIFPLIYSCSILTEWSCNSQFESCQTASQQAYIIY